MASIFLQLPTELQYHVLGFLGRRDLAEFTCSCRSFRNMGKALAQSRHARFHTGLDEAAAKIGCWIKENGLNFIQDTSKHMRYWLLARPVYELRNKQDVKLTLQQMAEVRDGFSSADNLFFAQGVQRQLPSVAATYHDLFARERMVMSVLTSCKENNRVEGDLRVVFEAMILGLCRLQLMSDKPIAVDSKSIVARRVFAISSLYARNIRGLDTDYDVVSQVSYELIAIGEMERVFVFLEAADACSEKERIARGVVLFLDALCRYGEGKMSQPIDPWFVDHTLSAFLIQKLRRRLTVHMNTLGYFFPPKETGNYVYWTGGRQYRFRIECTWGFRYDTIRRYWLYGQQQHARQCIEQLFVEKEGARAKANVLLYLGFCLGMTLLEMDRIRGSCPLMLGEATFEDYLAWLSEILSLAPQSEQKDVVIFFLQEQEKLAALSIEVKQRVHAALVPFLEESFEDASECLACQNHESVLSTK